MRTFNLRLVLWLAGILLVVAVSVHYLHRYQVRRNAGNYLTLATEKDAVARDENLTIPERRKALDAALQHYRRYLALDPYNVQARAAYGKLLVVGGDLSRAYFQFEHVLRTGPDDPENEEEVRQLQKLQNEIRRMQVDVAMAVRRYSDAIVHLKPLLEQTDGKDSALLELLARCEAESGRNEDALKTLDEAIKNSPDRLSAYRLKMDWQRKLLKDWAGAGTTRDDMLKANPQNADALLLHAEYLLSDKDVNDKDSSGQDQRLAQATTECADALTLAPEHAVGLALAAECARQNAVRAQQNKELDQASELFSQARELLRKSIAIESDVPRRYQELANVELLANEGDRAAAVKAAMGVIREGIAAIPDRTRNFDLRWQLANWLIDTSRSNAQEAKELLVLLAEMRKESPDSAFIDYLDARRLFADQKWSESRKVLEAVRGRLSKLPVLQMQADMLLATCSKQLGDNDLWLTAVRQKLDLNPLSIDARREYAEALLSVGRWLEALREYDQLANTMGGHMPLDMMKQYFLLKRSATLQQPPDNRNWALLTAMLDDVAATAPNDPWVPIMRAELALAGEKPEGPKKVAETPAGNQVVEQTPAGNPVVEQTPVSAKDVAQKILEAACLKTPNEQSLWMARLELAQQQKNSEQVAQLLSEIEKIFGDTVDVRLAKARVLVNQKGKEAVPELAAFAQNLDQITGTPERLQLYYQLARLCLSAGEPAQGLVYGRQAAELAPNSLQIRIFLLQVARSAMDVQAAQQMAAEIEKIEQGGAVTLFSQALYELTRYAKNSQNTQDAAAMQIAGEALQAARNKLLQAEQKRPNWAQVPLLLGSIAALQKDENDALTCYRRAVDLGNRDPAVITLVANILFNRGRWDEAEEVVRKSEEQGGGESFDMALLASRIAASREDYERALEKVEIPIAAGANRSDLYLFKGRLLDIQGNLEGAKSSIQEAIELDPKDGMAYLAMVQLLVKEVRILEQAGKQDEAAAKRAEAEKVLADVAQSVAPEKMAQTIAQCRDLLEQTEDAVKQFDAAIQQTPNDPGLLEAAARCYVKYPVLWEKAKPILKRFSNGELTKPEDVKTPAWARRELIAIAARSNSHKGFLEAMKLSDLNLQADPNSAVDLELRARLLESRGLRSLQKEALEVLERRAQIPNIPKPTLELQLLQAQLYLALGEWPKGRSLMANVVSAAQAGVGKAIDKAPNTANDAYRRFATYANAHINALLNHDEVKEAKEWMGAWRRVDPKALYVAMLEARALVPRKRSEPGAVAATLHVQEAIKAINTAVEDPEVKPKREAKMALAVPMLEEFLDIVTKNGSAATTDADALKAKIRDYYQGIIDGDPKLQAERQLLPVRFLVGQGERRRAVDLVKQHWGEATIDIFVTACGALLNFNADLKNIEARELSPQFSAEDREKQKAELMATVGETEAVVQQALVKYQAELATAAESDKPQKSAVVISLVSLLANQYLNTDRYPEAIAAYGEILALQPQDVVALNNRAMLMAGTQQNLPQALEQIKKAVELSGPKPLFVDSLAMVLFANGKTAEALEAAKQVMLEKPERLDPVADQELAKSWGGYSFHLALMYDAQGDQAQAIQAMLEAKMLGFGQADVSRLELPEWNKLVAKLGLEMD